MNVLGLHFGHDAGVCVLRDGKVASFVSRERHRRIKHAISLEAKNIQTAVEAAGLTFDQIDYVAITSTQSIELIIDDASKFSLSLSAHPRHTAPCTLADVLRQQQIDPQSLMQEHLMEVFYSEGAESRYLYKHYGPSFPEFRTRRREDFNNFGWSDSHVNDGAWTGQTLDELATANCSRAINSDDLRFGMHLPVSVQLFGNSIPGYLIAHHAAHAGSTYYQSGWKSAAVFTHDGFGSGASTLGGLFFWGEGHKLFPLSPHHLELGSLYENVGVQLGLGDMGAPGKLMGLAAYGQPRFFHRNLVGNHFDWKARGMTAINWLSHCLTRAQQMNYDLTPFGDRHQSTAPINVDIAASTQKLFEESYLAATDSLFFMLGLVGKFTDSLCLSGGTALNCPSNSRIFRESKFRRVFIEPGCDDSGLAFGAAAFLHHNVLDQPLPTSPADPNLIPYQGVPISSESILQALTAVQDKIDFKTCDNAAQDAAKDLVANQVIGWFEGRSEIGPRALGHRSILADPRHADNWPRVNKLKGREMWRPFAPAVLESEAEKWFTGLPLPSPYMLFTGFVRSNKLPAITHHDGTARIQTVAPACGEFYQVIENFFRETGIPVVMNTSFNGPGEPIVETPENAIHFLIHSTLDALYIGGYRVTRRNPTS